MKTGTVTKQMSINVIASLISFTVTTGINFFLTPYLTRELGTEAYGFIGLANNFVQYATVLTSALNAMSGRFISIAYHRGEKERASEIFSSVLAADLLIAAVMLAAASILTCLLDRILVIPASTAGVENLVLNVKITFGITFLTFVISVITAIFTTATYVQNRVDINSIRDILSNLLKIAVLFVLIGFFEIRLYTLAAAMLASGIFLLFANISVKKRILPDVEIRLSKFRFSLVKTLIAAGIWMSLAQLSNTFLSGLDLLICNLTLGAGIMGILSIAKTIPHSIALLISTLSNVFAPHYTILYAKKKITELVAEVKFTSKLVSFILTVPITGFMVFGSSFFALWQPEKTAEELLMIQILSVLTCIQYLFTAHTQCLTMLNSVCNKMKLPVLVALMIGILSTGSVLLLLKYWEIGTAGVYLIAGISSLLMSLRAILFIPIYSAGLLKQKKLTFYPPILRGWAAFLVLLVFDLMVEAVSEIHSWGKLVMICGICGVLGYVITFFVIFSSEERKKIMKKFGKRRITQTEKKIKLKKNHFLVGLLLSALLLTGCSSENPENMLQKAKESYAAGKLQEAEYQLALYLQEFPADVEANQLLGDWYAETGDERAATYYRKAAQNVEYEEGSLNYNYSSQILVGSIESLIIKPVVNSTKAMSVTCSANCFRIDQNSEAGKINKGDFELEVGECRTSAWFPVNSSAEELSIYGKINCAIWQFQDKDGQISYFTDLSLINSYETIRFSNQSYVTVKIPESAVWARVTYLDPTIEDTVTLDEGVYVQYGSFIQGYTSQTVQSFSLPDLAGEDYIEYRDGSWSLYSNGTQTKLPFEKIAEQSRYLSVSGEQIGAVVYTTAEPQKVTSDRSKEYGISFQSDGTDFSCRRIADAQGMNFNFMMDGTWAGYGANDFDQAYPWCEIKRCNIKIEEDQTVITYEGEAGYTEDGSNGNVMVEIPKFYVKRIVEDGCETISISGTNHDGYQLEPAFIGADGTEQESIYVGAYLGSKAGGTAMRSMTDTFPEIKEYFNDAVAAAQDNGAGFMELDYVTYAALQKLFLVETGNRNSSSLFGGDTADYYFYEDEAKSGYALYDAEQSNSITVNTNLLTSRLQVGDAVTIFEGWETYANTAEYQREIVSILRNGKETLTITFTGDPIDIYAGQTAISNIPAKNGHTDDLVYCTGISDRGNGKSSFQYRGIENLYGGVLTILANAEMIENHFYYATADGTTYALQADVIIQPQSFTDVDYMNRNLAIKEMCYDPENPLVMLPSQLGDGASAVSSYGDFWMLYLTEHTEEVRYLTAGGANDNFQLAGLFHLRAHFLKDSKKNQNSGYMGARIMYRLT